ncbi:MAG: hypothetical protein WAN34_07925, partial [Acidimicrobiia bacterium]
MTSSRDSDLNETADPRSAESRTGSEATGRGDEQAPSLEGSLKVALLMLRAGPLLILIALIVVIS